VPIIAAGGIVDGPSMAAAFALGAEGCRSARAWSAAAESPVHENWKQAIVDAAETDTVFLNRFSRPGLRALRTARTTELEKQEHVGMDQFGRSPDLYFGGDMEAAIALTGQVAGRIDEVKPVADIIDEMVAGFAATAGTLGPGEGRAVRLRRVGGREHERRVVVAGLTLVAQPVDGAGQANWAAPRPATK
jgi:enoyl-[acyl-carrier protein] reductase II